MPSLIDQQPGLKALLLNMIQGETGPATVLDALDRAQEKPMSQIHGMSQEVFEALPAEAKTALAAAYAENARLKASKGPGLHLKVTPKGCVQLRGIKGISMRFGLNLRAVTLQAIRENWDEIESFMAKNPVVWEDNREQD